MGTEIISDDIINSAKYVLNLHTGLSPYIRGSYSNLWPFLHTDPKYFGYTVHLMSSGIDSGDIVYSGQPDFHISDNYFTINCKSIIICTSMMVKAFEKIKLNQLYSIKQWEKGTVYFNRHWNNYVAYRYFKNRNNVLLKITSKSKNQTSGFFVVENGEKKFV